MGKTFRRDSDWNKNKERNLRKSREIEKAARRAAIEADADDEPYSISGETNDSYWENRSRLPRQ